jgi:predicted membrane-bound dolichyl-phosphate-mannose-protein mannosyltransferase
MSRKRFIRHLILPSNAPAALIWLYFTPKNAFGCANRGYMALTIVILSLVAAVVTASKGIAEKRRGETESANWWIVTTLILLFPLVLLVGPLG